MKIGILGTGVVGRTHAEKLIKLGHEVMIGTRAVERTLAVTEVDEMGNLPFSQWQQNNLRVKLGTFEEASIFGEIIINALPGENVLAAFDSLSKTALKDKIIIDIANALDFSKGMPPQLSVSDGNSLAEQLQRLVPEAKIVKTLNTVAAQLQTDPIKLANGDHDVFVSGNDQAAKKIVKIILQSYGWKNIIDLGDITTARGTELLMPIWLRLWGVIGTANFNYKIVK